MDEDKSAMAEVTMVSAEVLAVVSATVSTAVSTAAAAAAATGELVAAAASSHRQQYLTETEDGEAMEHGVMFSGTNTNGKECGGGV